MIDDRDVQEMLHRRADAVPIVAVDTPTAVRRARRRLLLNGAVATVAAVAIAVATFTGVDAVGSAPVPADRRSGDLGIFAPVARRIVYVNEEIGNNGIDRGYDPGVWAVDPSGPADTAEGSVVADDVASTLVGVNLAGGEPLGWSSDGTELLIRRQDPTPEFSGCDICANDFLYVLHADGSETQLNQEPMGLAEYGASISPDGQHVAFAADGLWVVDSEGGQPVRVADEVNAPTFSPDGTQIAYLAGNTGSEVWVVNADGSDAHEILADATVIRATTGLVWSPAGDRLAVGVGMAKGLGKPAIYTFAPDGSDVTKVIAGGAWPYWSPDGSQIAYTIPCDEHPHGWCPEGSILRSEFDPQPGDSPAGLAIVDADGSNVRAFGFAASGPWHPGSPVENVPAPVETATPVETDGEVLGFTGGPDGEPADLVAVNPQTGQSRVLVSGLPVVNAARWSADRRWVAYEDDAGLWVVGPGQVPRPVTSGSVPLWSWSPEGARLALLEGRTLSILDVTSDNTTELGTVTSDVSGPVWSPDGTRLVYGANGGTVWSVDVESGERSVLVKIPGDDLESMDQIHWSPDGAWLAINVDVVPGYARMYLVGANGSDIRVLCDDNNDNECGDMAWSPDGDRLAYLEYVGGLGPQILTQAPYGGSPVLVGKAEFGSCAAGGCGLPVWSPDGSMIAMHGGYESVDPIFLAVDADGTGNVVPIDGMTYQSWDDGAYDLSWFKDWW